MDALLADAQRCLTAGQYPEAERLSRRALEAEPQLALAKLLLALAWQGQNRHEDAAAALRELAQADPSNRLYWSNLGTALRSCGEYEESLRAYERAAALGEASADFYFNLGLLYVDRLEFGKARAALKQAAAQAPADAEIRYFLASASFEEIENEDAEAALSEWPRFEGLDADVLTRIGTLLMQLGETAQAEAAFREALRCDPDGMLAAVRLVQLLERNNRVVEARRQLGSVRLRSPTGEAAEDLLAAEARLAERENDLQTARRKYEELLALVPQPHQRYHALFPLARVCDALGDYERAAAVAADAHASQRLFLAKAAPAMLEPGRQVFGICNFGCDAADVQRWATDDAPTAEESPVFIVAFPRSGTTLLEQMLDAHPALRSMDEQPFLQRALDEIRRLGVMYPEQLGRLTAAQLALVRAHYWQLVRSKVRLEPGQRLVDKNPLNLLRLPAIRRLFRGIL